MNKISLVFLFCMICTGIAQNASARKIHDHKYKYKLSLPDQLIEIKDSLASVDERMYFDSTAGVVLTISTRTSKFKSVTDYLDCSNEALEKQLQYFYADSSLTLISCNKPARYAKQTNILHFRVSAPPGEYDTDMIYFIHHRKKDIQFFFTYRKETEQTSADYIGTVMRNLRLK